jgi:hypothetical protein
MRWLLLAGLLAGLVSCGGDDDDGGGGSAIAGTYFGTFALMHNDDTKAIVASVELRVAESGDVAGSTFTTQAPTSVVGEVGALTGTLDLRDQLAIDADLTLTFPTLGTYTMKGALNYAEPTRAIAGLISNTRDSTNQVIGTASLSVMK